MLVAMIIIRADDLPTKSLLQFPIRNLVRKVDGGAMDHYGEGVLDSHV